MSSTPTKNHRSPILVTGAHRTGTTWVGKMMAASGQVAYISEPLNVLHRPGVLGVPVQRWYTYITDENEAAYLPALRQTINFRYRVLAEIRSLRSVKDVLRMARDWSIFTRGRLFHQRALLKDPFAVFSAPWFAKQLGCQVVITVRHPAAFASSLKWLKWHFDFNDLLAQPWLMQDLLEPFRYDMEKALHECDDVIAQASLLWRIVYQVILEYQQKFPDFQVVRHEDLSLDPIQGFEALYKRMGLSFSDRAQKVILQSSSADNPKQLSKGKVHRVRLDSRANLDNWKRRLEREEIRRVRQITEDIALTYYPDQTWD
jgi:hypothetical protein